MQVSARIGISSAIFEYPAHSRSSQSWISRQKFLAAPEKPAPALPLSMPVATCAADVCRSGGHRHKSSPTSESVRLVSYHAMRWSNS